MENKINTNIILVDDYSINDLTGYIKSWMAEYKESLDKKFEIKIYEINVKGLLSLFHKIFQVHFSTILSII
ncbi:MAG: hypothetical protein IPO37_09955 [Saprospiraceae bacterium]|nr:hypothetical protein [Saprospiraceae bacterium]